MGKPAQWIQKSMDVAISRARYEKADLHLPGSAPGKANDREAIRLATRVYVESWLIPLLEAVRDGDMGLAKSYSR